MPLFITQSIILNDTELEERFVTASGPGGQNVNKVATAVQLRFDVVRSPSLPEDVRQRLVKLCGRRLSKDGVLTLICRQYRTQERNRVEARARLAELVRQAARPLPIRRATKPTAASKRRRVEGKKARSTVKQSRRKISREYSV